MKLSLAVLLSGLIAAAYAPLDVRAAECSAAQQAAANVLGGDPEFETACAAVFSDESADVDAATLTALNATTLEALSPCKQPTCAAYLKKQADKVPDCEVSGVNARVVFTTIVDFCNNATAESSANEAKVTDSSIETTDGSASSSSSSGSEAGSMTAGSTGTTSQTKTPTTVGDSDSDSDGDKTPSLSTTKKDDPVLNANTKSDANSAAYAGVTAVAAGVLLTVLCM